MRVYEKFVTAALCLAVLVVSLLTWSDYEGSFGPFVLFAASFLAMALLALPRPRSYAYSFLAAFLFLGFWSKFSAHALFDYPFVEPTGRFDNSGTAWDAVLIASSFVALGVALARVLLLALRLPRESWRDGDAPSWYRAVRVPLWAVTMVSIIALNAANAVYGFIQIGLEARLVLPAHLNIAAAWLVNVGFALWVATLVFWEGRTRPDRLGLALFAPLLEGMLSAGSMLSRKNFLFHTVPYVLVLLEKGSWRAAMSRATKFSLAAAFVALFAISLVAVSVTRLYAYLPPEPTAAQEASAEDPGTQQPVPEPTAAQEAPAEDPGTQQPVPELRAMDPARISGMARQVLGLAVDRWTGIEGVMAVSSYPGLGWELLLRGVFEDPNTGEGAIYQRTSGAGEIYAKSEQTTFLTLPGSAAILLFSGSFLVVLLGMGIVAALLVLIECAIVRLLGNPFLASVSGMLMAYVVVDLNFPYLAAVFFVELAATLFCIWLLQAGTNLLRWRRAPSKKTA